MIEFVTGNLFDSPAEALVNTVNCVGVMGKGIAYQFKRAYPGMYEEYRRQCGRHEIRPGAVTSFAENGKLIINFPTKDHWRSRSRIEDIVSGLDALRAFLVEREVASVAVPPLGCGNGGLDWAAVRPLVEEKLGGLERVHVFVYEPRGSFSAKLAEKPKLSLASYVLVALRSRLQGRSKLALQKMTYFFNVFVGEEYFKFTAHKFGPYNPGLDPMMRKVAEHLEFTGQGPAEMIAAGLDHELAGKAADQLRAWLPAIDAVADFCSRHYSDLEGLATAHAVIHELGPTDLDAVTRRFLSWSEEKAARFGPADVRRAVDVLVAEGLVVPTLLGLEEAPYAEVRARGLRATA
ncbi:MAG: hypothetical protein EP329_26385 [Deltaproteobacteria bacterium]|nr:MAG: hypothetical protein EP329_26385 [Deltaproteobacteria bacterium]